MRVMQWWTISWLIRIIVCIFTTFLYSYFLPIDNFFILLNHLYQICWFWPIFNLRADFRLNFILNFMLVAYLMTTSTFFCDPCWLLNYLSRLCPTFINGNFRSIIAMTVFKGFAVTDALFAGFFIRWIVL
jgi:hypothetical protein